MLNSPLFLSIIPFPQGRNQRPFLYPEEVNMQKVYIDIKQVDDRRVIEMSIGGITAVCHGVGRQSQFRATGRGNVRQVKALLREFVRNSDPATI
jgi:hypothetical protein